MPFSICNLFLYTFLTLFSTVVLSEQNYLTESQIKKAIVNHTLIGNDWAEFYSSSGQIIGRARFLGFIRNYSGRWKVSGEKICYTYEDSQFNTCSKLESRVDQIIHYHLDGTIKNDGVAIRVQGNQTAQLK